ncbi:ABC transporter ATP-binding protein [Kallipyga gabonensis]|uniref:ABC transporter ATP-binding protein n=1 Tax=Kallipyga gabonensis TaxID=1686287 RepID=UPI0006B43AE8|nr:ABC transporter ATP-binding protein [Kallipyga gabonensis]
MENKSSTFGFRETLAIHRRAVIDMDRLAPGCFVPFILSSGVKAISPYVSIWLSAQVINELASFRRPDALGRWIILILVITIVTDLLQAVLDRWKNVKDELFYNQYESLYTEKFLQLDYADCDKQEVRDLFTQIQQSSNWGGWGFAYLPMYFSQAVEGFFGILSALALTVSLFTQMVPSSGGSLTLLNHPIFIAAILLFILGVTFLGPALGKKANSIWSDLAEESRFGNRLFSHFCFIELGNKEKDMDRRIYCQGDLMAHYVDTVNIFGVGSHFDRLLATTVGLRTAFAAGLSAILSGGIYLFVCLKALGGAFGVGSVTQYVRAVTSFSGNASMLLETVNHMQTNAEFLTSIYQFLDIPNVMAEGKQTLEKGRGLLYEVEFKDVSFKYPGSDLWALRHINFRFKQGSHLAIVGENGSGKTTFIKLLCRLYDPQEGQILLNGVDIRDYRYDDYMDFFAVVFQDFQLLDQPLGNNVAGRSGYDRGEVRDALVEAGFGEKLSQMERGLDTMLYKKLSEEGVDLSGGEAQKVAIARAIYKDAPFIILDEPTAALDPIAEAEIYSKFDQVAQEKTTIFISHRLSSCKFCDEIAVFDEGRIIQQGSHEDLLAGGKGKYHDLWTAQAQYYTK